MNDVTFNNEKSAYYDWNVVLVKADIPLPSPKTLAVNIAGADGVIDLSEVVSGDIKFNNRTIKLTFEMMDDTNYTSLISEMANYFHGKVLTFRFDNDDSWYWKGRAVINTWECVRRLGKIVVAIDCEPYKYANTETSVMITVSNNTKNIILKNERKHICPELVVTGTPTLVWNGVDYPLTSSVTQLINLVLGEGDNFIKVKGNGTVNIKYRQGCL